MCKKRIPWNLFLIISFREFLSEMLWESEQKELLETLKTKYHSSLSQKIEDTFQNEWSAYSQYYVKKIIEDFSIQESLVHFHTSLLPYTSKQDVIFSWTPSHPQI